MKNLKIMRKKAIKKQFKKENHGIKPQVKDPKNSLKKRYYVLQNKSIYNYNLFIMTTNKMKFDNFQNEKLSKTQQKTVRGGDTVGVDPTDPKYDPTKGGSTGNG